MNINMFMFKRRLKINAVADILYEDIFLLLSDKFTNNLRLELISSAHLESLSQQFNFECYALISFIITFTFQRKFIDLGQEKCKMVLDMFHIRLFDNIDIQFKEKNFPDILKERYAEYYPIMKEDLECVKNGIGEILFRGITEAFFGKIAPDKLISKESLLFGFLIAERYSLINKSFDKIKKYKIA